MLMLYVFNLYQKIKALFCSVRQVQPLVDNICHFTSEGQLPLFAIDTDIFSSLLQMTLEESMARRYDYFWGFALLLYFEVWLDCRTVLSSVLCLCSRRLKRRERETSWLGRKVREKSFESMVVTLSSIKRFSTATSVQFITLLFFCFFFLILQYRKSENTLYQRVCHLLEVRVNKWQIIDKMWVDFLFNFSSESLLRSLRGHLSRMQSSQHRFP